MSTCVVFAVSIFDSDKIYVLRDFLECFRKNFSDCDFYIGVNFGSIEEVEGIIKEYDLKANVIRLHNSNLYCGSDASAYQIALSLLQSSNKCYDVCWFAHTKGAVNNRFFEREMYLSNLFGKRSLVENLFESKEFFGSYALRGVSRGAAGHDWSVFNNDHHIEICSNVAFDVFNYTHVNWSYIETMYTIRGNVVQAFLRNVSDLFFSTKIQEPCYFEITFPWTVSRMGYFPYVKENRCFFGEADLKTITQNWLNKNNLTHLIPYLSLP